MSLFTSFAIKILDWASKYPQYGLPNEVFYFISRSTPLINVDLLVKDKKNRVLLSWRDDQYSGTGWHIPGGIIRYKESIKNRIDEVSKHELKGQVTYEIKPLAINEIVASKHKNRGHFISLLFNCYLSHDYKIDNGKLTSQDPGFLKWFNECPENLISWHEIYREYIELNKVNSNNKFLGLHE
jgi:ADP-ribose pyrophosphatase YjhB (NUDIX family)